MIQGTIFCEKLNETYCKIHTEKSILRELSESLTFYVPGYQFMPSYKIKAWDGKIRLINLKDATTYIGLHQYIQQFCEKHNYIYSFPEISTTNFSLNEANEYITKLKIPSKFEKRDYQIESFAHAIRNKRCLFLSPTSSGKSYLCYLITRYLNKKTLIVVPNITLVDQLYSDFEDYGFNSEKYINKIYGGKNREIDKLITISTWQSIFELPAEWFKEYQVIIGDEAHNYKADSLKEIMSKLDNCSYRIGMTGTLDGTKTNQIIIEGLFGPIKNVITTKELMDNKTISSATIKSLMLKYSNESRKFISQKSYMEEIKFLIENEKRNDFIANLALSLKGNGIILFQYVEDHGVPLYNKIEKLNNKKIPLFFASGKVDSKIRNEMREKINKSKNSITVASYGVYSTGINIPNINWIITTSPTKSKIRILQSIGRGLRKSDTKDTFTFYDIVDDLSSKSYKNFALKHGIQRIKYYKDAEFLIKYYNINLEE